MLDARIDQCPLTLAEPPLRGYIGLQNHGVGGQFRNVKLLRLDAELGLGRRSATLIDGRDAGPDRDQVDAPRARLATATGLRSGE